MPVVFTKLPSGVWGVKGPPSELRVGQVDVVKKDGSTKTVMVEHVTREFEHPPHSGRWFAYGHLWGTSRDRSSRARHGISHTPRDDHAPRWHGDRVVAPVSMLDRGVVQVGGDTVEIACYGRTWEFKGVRMAYGVPREPLDAY